MRVLYVTTTFPVYSETFLQREARAMRAQGVELRIVSLHRGDPTFEGFPVSRFPKIRLWRIFYLLPLAMFRHGERLLALARALRSRPNSCLNLFENLLGLGIALLDAREAAKFKPDVVHAVWAGAPAAYAMLLSVLIRVPYSMGAHAYDVFEGGGDWLLAEKSKRAILIHCSTGRAARRMREWTREQKVVCIRRGLTSVPDLKPLRPRRHPLRLLCVARLVEKKGFPQQLRIYQALREKGVDFEARIGGSGPLSGWLEERLRENGLAQQVTLLGRLTEVEVWEQLSWADALIHTGVVAASGDRDGLPNVVPEAMAAGVVVIASPQDGVREAVVHGATGLLCPVDDLGAWVEACCRVQCDAELCEALRDRARAWVANSFSAEQNTGELLRRLDSALTRMRTLNAAGSGRLTDAFSTY